jgi:exocyst complex component 7
LSRLQVIHENVNKAVAQTSQKLVRDTPTGRAYIEVRGGYINNSLKNLAAASVSTARKTTPNAIYRQGTNGLGTYATGMEGIYYAEFDNVTAVFHREDQGMMFSTTCQASVKEFNKTIRDLNVHIQNNLLTDCFLGYEIIDIVTQLSFRLEGRTGELRRPILEALEPVRNTSKASFYKLLEDTRDKVGSLISLPIDASAVPISSETMLRLQTMASFIKPVSSILTSLGDGGWKTPNTAPNSSTFDVGADGQELFNHYAQDMVDALLNSLTGKAASLLKSKGAQGVFMHNNVSIVHRMITNSELVTMLNSATSNKVEGFRKKATALYQAAWKEPSAQLLDVQYTNRGGRPTSGGTGGMDSAAVVRNLSSKDRDAIKEKFKNFNASFDELVQRHKSYKMERETRTALAKEIQQMIEPLYGRFWDRYHEIDKGKGKYVKYDKQQLASVISGLS